MGEGERLLKASDVAELLGVSMGTVLDWWQEGKLPGFRLGGSVGSPVRFRMSEIEAWLDSCRGGPRVPPRRDERALRSVR